MNGGNVDVCHMTHAEQFRNMKFAQLNSRESLRAIEVTLGANVNKLYAMGLHHRLHHSTLVNANETSDKRIWSDVAALLTRRIRKLFSNTDLVGLFLNFTVYALAVITFVLYLSMFDWASFRKAKGAVKLYILLDPRGAIPSVIHNSDGKMHEVIMLYFISIEAGIFYVNDRSYLDFTRLYALHQTDRYFCYTRKS